jgi:CRP-like cAMP-binding protein
MLLTELFKQNGRQRDIKTIETLLKHLTYLKKQDKELRKLIYRRAELVKFQSQKEIFRYGDRGDYMYIILKGLVNVQIPDHHYKYEKIVA